MGDIVDQEGDCQHDDGAGAYGYEGVEEPEVVDFLASDHRNESGCSSRRMEGLGGVHGRNGCGHRDGCGEPEL